jgi:hypothetical protein
MVDNQPIEGSLGCSFMFMAEDDAIQFAVGAQKASLLISKVK